MTATHSTDWLKTHHFTAEDLQRPGGRGLAHVAARCYDNASARAAVNDTSQLEQARTQQRHAEQSTMDAQMQAGRQ